MIDIKFLRENPEVVKENISSAVQALFDIEPHKIRIMKKQMN